MRTTIAAAGVIITLLFTLPARADQIRLVSGNTIECQILNDQGERVTFLKGVSTFSVARDQVASISRTAAAPGAVGADLSRLPSEPEAIAYLSKQAWAQPPEQIPATVIDKGILKNVPYLSHRSGDYELNVYGDPDAPAGLEIGIYRQLLNDPAAKAHCVEFIATLVGKDRAAALARLKRDKDVVTVGEWTIEITPPTDEDAYGGWWVSVYSEKMLDKSRASAEELRSITVAQQAEARQAAVDKNNAETALAANRAAAAPGSYGNDDWTPGDMSRSRGYGGDLKSTGGGGSVFVRGYTRKDGTYVRSYTRSAPGTRGGRR